MDLHARLRAIVDPLPEGAAVTLPVDAVRAWLAEDGAGETPVDLTVEEVGRLLSRAPSTIRTWCGAGRIRGAYRLRGREWRIPRAGLRALREEDTAAPATGKAADLGSWREVAR